jgi:hypothetical protein
MTIPLRNGEYYLDFSQWTDYTPTLTWTGGTPAAITTIARYCRCGFVVFGNVDISSADSNACSNLTISLPIAPALHSANMRITSYEKAGAGGVTYTTAIGYIDPSDSLIKFRNFTTATDNQAFAMVCSFFYEVDT